MSSLGPRSSVPARADSPPRGASLSPFSEPVALRVLFPYPCDDWGIGWCVMALCDRFHSEVFQAEYWAPSVARGHLRSYHRVPMPNLISRGYFRVGLPEYGLRRHVESRFLANTKAGDVAFLWPGVSLHVFERLHERGVRIVLERVNSHRANSLKVLDRAYKRLGLEPSHGIRRSQVSEETRKLALADRVFCCSPYVHASLREARVPEEKLLHTSYGWDPRAFRIEPQPRSGRPVFLSVANGSVRKGTAELLEAWCAASPNATLRLVGPIEPALAERYHAELSRPDVEVWGYQADLAKVYAGADVFVLASHEEGSPLVSYLAQAAGLPTLVSDAGAGGIVDDGVHGLVREPYDHEGWVEALLTLSSDSGLRARMREASLERAQEYTWDKVAARRQEQLEGFIQG